MTFKVGRNASILVLMAMLLSEPVNASTRVPPTTATSVPMASNTIDLLSQLPKDEKGRVIGGNIFPLLNYSPTMITGKPCPRVTQWQVDVVKMQPPLRDFGMVKNPCVVQNAVDDLVRTLYFTPAYQTPETMREIDAIYDTDVMNVNGVTDPLRRSMIQQYRSGKGIYQRCNQPVYRLLNVDAKALFPTNPAGRITGTTMQVSLLKVVQGVAPFECQFVFYQNGSVFRVARVTASDTRFAALQYELRWSSKTKTWMMDSFDGFQMDDYAETAYALLAASPVKP